MKASLPHYTYLIVVFMHFGRKLIGLATNSLNCYQIKITRGRKKKEDSWFLQKKIERERRKKEHR